MRDIQHSDQKGRMIAFKLEEKGAGWEEQEGGFVANMQKAQELAERHSGFARIYDVFVDEGRGEVGVAMEWLRVCCIYLTFGLHSPGRTLTCL